MTFTTDDLSTLDNDTHRSQQDIRAHNQAVILKAAEEEFVLKTGEAKTK